MSLDQLAATISGSLVLPGSADFDGARLYHGRAGDPAAVAHVGGVDDVVAAVGAAREERLPVAIRGGGHSNWESLPGALVIDLRALREVVVDQDAAPTADGARLVHVGGGATWGEVAEELARHGLAISSGDTRSVGVGGLTLGAGIGWVVRCWGLALDQLVGAQLVTAGGDVLELSETSYPELFWGVRGGGGNLGVVTRFDFLAHPLTGVVHAAITLDGADLPALIRAFRDVMRAAPRELNGSLMRTPPMGPELPSRTVIELAWAGPDEAAARAAFAPLLGLPQVTASEVAPVAYPDLLQEPPMPPPGMTMPTIVDENGWFESLDDHVIDALVAGAAEAGAPMLLVRWLGGAFGDVAPEATAIGFRRAEAFVMSAAFVPPDGTAEDVARVKAALAPFVEHSVGAYGNFTNSVAPGLPERMYTQPTLARLRALKLEWDRDNLFSRNHNVVPVVG
ncbi:MAG: FAD-binding protein [Propionibacteriaceae bacterium]|nr:FAD-binding protein [Propionibacteriaceae bacterium]